MSIILIVLLIIFLVLFLTNKQSNPSKKQICSGIHKWVYKKQPDNEEIEYLVCENCGMFPGEEVD